MGDYVKQMKKLGMHHANNFAGGQKLMNRTSTRTKSMGQDLNKYLGQRKVSRQGGQSNVSAVRESNNYGTVAPKN